MERLLIEPGEKVLTLFLIHDGVDRNVQHFMIGEVIKSSDIGIRVTGYAFYVDFQANTFVRRKELQSVVFAYADPRLVQVVLPLSWNIDALAFEARPEPRLTAGAQFSLNLRDLVMLQHRVSK